jgi:hypothetical protein
MNDGRGEELQDQARYQTEAAESAGTFVDAERRREHPDSAPAVVIDRMEVWASSHSGLECSELIVPVLVGYPETLILLLPRTCSYMQFIASASWTGSPRSTEQDEVLPRRFPPCTRETSLGYRNTIQEATTDPGCSQRATRVNHKSLSRTSSESLRTGSRAAQTSADSISTVGVYDGSLFLRFL